MSFLKKDTVYAFSGFEGQLLYEGKPAAGALVTRTWDVYGKEGKDATTTDSNGIFKFKSISLKYRAPLLAPLDFLSHQELTVQYDKKEFVIWSGAKHSREEFTEFGGKPKNFHCELTGDPDQYRAMKIDGLLGTICYWDTEE